MSAEARFFPGVCPGCGDPVTAPYSRYARARAHALFLPLLLADFALAIVLVGAAFWGVAQVTEAMLGGQNLRLKERGLIYFAAVGLAASAAVWVCVRLGRLLGRLPRRFEYECGTCRWVGEVGVVVGGLADDAGLTARVVEVDETGPLAAMRDRRDQRELARRREEQDGPPNTDFDFGRRDP